MFNYSKQIKPISFFALKHFLLYLPTKAFKKKLYNSVKHIKNKIQREYFGLLLNFRFNLKKWDSLVKKKFSSNLMFDQKHILPFIYNVFRI